MVQIRHPKFSWKLPGTESAWGPWYWKFLNLHLLPSTSITSDTGRTWSEMHLGDSSWMWETAGQGSTQTAQKKEAWSNTIIQPCNSAEEEEEKHVKISAIWTPLISEVPAPWTQLCWASFLGLDRNQRLTSDLQSQGPLPTTRSWVKGDMMALWRMYI
jgi:hypothetical protein